ncbi:MAG: TRAM domain-containing protein [Bacteroidia bacterium]|nr:TRAM domain-containing protein [Bacteroidia bacterium]
MPRCAVTTDIMVGFCTEAEDDHNATLSLMEYAKFDFAYMFKYSERPDTYAALNLKDDVAEKTKAERLKQVIELQGKISKLVKNNDIGKTYEVLIEGISKKSKGHFFGRNSQNKVVVFPKENYKTGDYVNVLVTDCTSATLIGNVTSGKYY